MTKQQKERRDRIATEVLAGIMSNQKLIEIISQRDNNLSEERDVCRTAVNFADMLIEELDT